MKRPVCVLCAVVAVCTFVFVPADGASINAQEIETKVRQSKVLSYPDNTKVSVLGNAVSISTYAKKGATDKDCKIDAVLLARELLDVPSLHIESVTVTFYQVGGSGAAREVKLTARDVKVFGAGLIDDEKLLQTVNLTKTVQSKVKMARFTGDGISVLYPEGWRRIAHGGYDGSAVCCWAPPSEKNPDEPNHYVEVFLYGVDGTVDEVARLRGGYHATFHTGYTVLEQPRRVKIGRQKNIDGIIESFRIIGNNGLPTIKSRIYFGWKNHVYKLGMACPESVDLSETRAIFNQMVESFEYDPVSLRKNPG